MEYTKIYLWGIGDFFDLWGIDEFGRITLKAVKTGNEFDNPSIDLVLTN